ncbi:hypothetical protein [Erysipelothrix aquatica]|uniref:hypothetical protein n=1 Tax=Erysipelothrix aquatica TaxID=2683714 RepID=UPI00135CD696|nr:hypothetical protein [Erysipelothrix aquatica]
MRRTHKLTLATLIGVALVGTYLFVSGWKFSTDAYIEDVCIGATIPQCDVGYKEDINQLDTLYILETDTHYLPIIFEKLGPLTRPKMLSGATYFEGSPIETYIRFYPKESTSSLTALTKYRTQPDTIVLAFPGDATKNYAVALKKTNQSYANNKEFGVFTFDDMFDEPEKIQKQGNYYVHVLPNDTSTNYVNYAVIESKLDGTKLMTIADYSIDIDGTVVEAYDSVSEQTINTPTPFQFSDVFRRRVHDTTLVDSALEENPILTLRYRDASINGIVVDDLQLSVYAFDPTETVTKWEWTDHNKTTRHTEIFLTHRDRYFTDRLFN